MGLDWIDEVEVIDDTVKADIVKDMVQENDKLRVTSVSSTHIASALAPGTDILNPDIMAKVNDLSADDDRMLRYRENIVSWSGALESRDDNAIVDYVEAVRYVSHRLTGDNIFTSYVKAFPHEVERAEAKKISFDTLKRQAKTYDRKSIVTKLYERSLVPIWISNADVLQEAINVQAGLMKNAKSEMVRTRAASSLIENLKPPEVKDKEESPDENARSIVDELAKISLELARKQIKAIENGGATAGEIARMKIIESE